MYPTLVIPLDDIEIHMCEYIYNTMNAVHNTLFS